MTTKPNLSNAVKQIDGQFGCNYAKENPELVGQYLIASAIHEIDETLSSVVQFITNNPISNILRILK